MSNRAVAFASLLLAAAGLWACWCDLALIWDGAYQFCYTLTSGAAYSYLSRFHSWVVWQPLAWIAPHTENLRLLKVLYGLPYCLAPLASVLLCWWVVRRRAPHLLLWSLFGAAAAPLPGQVFIINDSIFQMHLFWPVFLAALLPVSGGRAFFFGVLSLFQLSHPIGILLCGLASTASLAWSRWKPGAPVRVHQAWGWWLLALSAGGVAKLFLWPDAYAAREATREQVWMTFRWGVLWWPLAGLLAMWLAGLLLAWARHRPRASARPLLAHLALASVVVGGGCWLTWAAQPYLWQTAANYRRWLVPLSLPFLLLAAWELWRPGPVEQAAGLSAPGGLEQRGRDRVGLAVATIFLLVLGLQAWQWSRLFTRLGTEAAASPAHWLREQDLTWIRETPMAHWGLRSQLYVAQGRTPRVDLWNDDTVRLLLGERQQVALAPFHFLPVAQYPQSWFQWQELLNFSDLPLALPADGPAPDAPR